jgi:RNA polymerase sigma-70 factor (ECF subfamily)
VRQHQDRLFNAVYRMVGNHEDAADFVQETFLRALRGLGSFRGDSSFYTWIFSIAVNAIISERRKQTVRVYSTGDPSADESDSPHAHPPYPADTSTEPTRLAQQHEMHNRIHQAIQSLDEESRLLVVMRDIDGFNYEQISQTLTMPVGTVKSRLHRARLLLREMLKDLI